MLQFYVSQSIEPFVKIYYNVENYILNYRKTISFFSSDL